MKLSSRCGFNGWWVFPMGYIFLRKYSNLIVIYKFIKKNQLWDEIDNPQLPLDIPLLLPIYKLFWTEKNLELNFISECKNNRTHILFINFIVFVC